MPHSFPLLQDLLTLLVASVPIAFIFHRLRLPTIVGFMITGVLIGPYGLGLIHDAEAIELMAEIGVALLLFTIGLEFSLRRLLEMKRLVLLGGTLQVIVSILVVTFIAYGLGRSINQALFFGFLFALSSTAIVLKTYIDRAEVDAGADRGGLLIGQRGERDVDLGQLGVGDRLDALEHLVGDLARHARPIAFGGLFVETRARVAPAVRLP
mgnify:CR=1 FL=1